MACGDVCGVSDTWHLLLHEYLQSFLLGSLNIMRTHGCVDGCYMGESSDICFNLCGGPISKTYVVVV